jgi:pyruvate formate lyase activating enzyme
MEKAHQVASEHLDYVLLGNTPGHPGESTFCPKCKEVVIGRIGFQITKWNIDNDSKCKNCGKNIPIIGGLKRKI